MLILYNANSVMLITVFLVLQVPSVVLLPVRRLLNNLCLTLATFQVSKSTTLMMAAATALKFSLSSQKMLKIAFSHLDLVHNRWIRATHGQVPMIALSIS